MMKTFRMKYTVLFVLVLAFFTACASDGADPENSGGEAKAENLTVHMTLSTASPSTSRATTSWTDGTDAENMKSWVVAFVQDGKVVAFEEKTSVDADKRITDDVTITGLSAGTYQVYSFANLSASELGISKNASVDFDTKEWKMNGNGFDTSTNGIPMSNKQEVTVSADGSLSTNTLWVVRMLAKVTLKFKNPTTTALTINDITINDITQNPDASSSSSEANIMLLPKHSNANSDEVVCEPNLASTAKVRSYTYSLGSSPVNVAANKTDETTDISFYINESVAGNTSKYFIVNLNTSSGVKRYALFKDWTTIARNDHHILLITLDDYKLKFDVEAYSAIGLYPSVTDNGTTLSYTCYYPEEEFHIKPTVLSASDGEVSGVDYSKMTLELITEEGMTDETAAQANAQNVFQTLPTIDAKGYIEGVFKGDKADKQSALYKLTVPINDTKSLEYKVLFTKDLTTFAARKHYTRKFYRYE